MKKYRESIKHPLIGQAGINPEEYDKVRETNQQYYEHDKADAIIIKTAGDILEPRILRTFWLFYGCTGYDNAQKQLAEPDDEDNPKPLQRDTVLTYKRTAKRKIEAAIQKDKDIRKQITEAINDEFATAKTRNNQSILRTSQKTNL